jgi:ABC-type Fe3+ transport system permease subunit
MTGDANVVILADHSVWIAVPAFAPAIVVAGVVAYVAVRNRRRDDAPHSDGTAAASEDGAP